MGSLYNASFAYSDTEIILSLQESEAEDNTTGHVIVELPTSPLTRTAFSHLLLPC